MTRETIEIMAALADEKKIAKLDRALRTWKVQPKRYHKGYCPIICKSQKSAEHEQERLERTTGFEWTITVIPE